MYGKLFKSAFTGSMCGAGADVFAVWAYVISNKFRSTVELNPRIISFTIGMTPERAQAAIDFLCAPDPNSRNAAEDGRRLIKEGPFQYFVVSGDIYDAIQNEELRREQWRDSKSKGREKKKNASSEINDLGEMSTGVNTGQQVSTHIEVEGEVKVNVNTKDKTLKPLAESDKSLPAEAAPILTLPLNDGMEHGITEHDAGEWKSLYPAVDVLQELRNMKGWCIANPSNRKTSKGVTRFINGWLAREQNKAPRQGNSFNGKYGNARPSTGNRAQDRTNSNLDAARAAISSIIGPDTDGFSGGEAGSH